MPLPSYADTCYDGYVALRWLRNAASGALDALEQLNIGTVEQRGNVPCSIVPLLYCSTDPPFLRSEKWLHYYGRVLQRAQFSLVEGA